MEYFEREVMSTFDRPPEIWHRYVDDTFTKLHEYDADNFTDHLNARDPYIQFTMEPETDGKLPFLDTCQCQGRRYNKGHHLQEGHPYGVIP